MIMLYNRHSFRQLKLRNEGLTRRLLGKAADNEEARRAAYDANSAGDAAPETVFVTVRQVKEELFSPFSDVRVERHNFDMSTKLFTFRGKTHSLTRERALPTVARVLGLDLYITARK